MYIMLNMAIDIELKAISEEKENLMFSIALEDMMSGTQIGDVAVKKGRLIT